MFDKEYISVSSLVLLGRGLKIYKYNSFMSFKGDRVYELFAYIYESIYICSFFLNWYPLGSFRLGLCEIVIEH